jgi:hypothetical protein
MVENRFPKGDRRAKARGAALVRQNTPAADVSHDPCHTAFTYGNALFLLPLL